MYLLQNYFKTFFITKFFLLLTFFYIFTYLWVSLQKNISPPFYTLFYTYTWLLVREIFHLFSYFFCRKIKNLFNFFPLYLFTQKKSEKYVRQLFVYIIATAEKYFHQGSSKMHMMQSLIMLTVNYDRSEYNYASVRFLPRVYREKYIFCNKIKSIKSMRFINYLIKVDFCRWKPLSTEYDNWSSLSVNTTLIQTSDP